MGKATFTVYMQHFLSTTTHIKTGLKHLLSNTNELLITGDNSHCQPGNYEGSLFVLPKTNGEKEKSLYSSKMGSFS